MNSRVAYDAVMRVAKSMVGQSGGFRMRISGGWF